MDKLGFIGEIVYFGIAEGFFESRPLHPRKTFKVFYH
jgi:hypothetical protein